MTFVMDEEKWAEDTLMNATVEGGYVETLSRLARYFRHKGYTNREIRDELNRFLERSDKFIDVGCWKDAVERCIRRAGKYRLLVTDGVPVTKAEIEKINELDGMMKRKLMFTMLCVAKYFNMRNPETNNNWVNMKIRDLFSMADIQLTKKRQYLLLNELITAGYIRPSVAVDNTNMNVLIINADSEQEMLVTSFKNLGNQYMLHCGERYLVCAECGAVVKRGSNRQRFCHKCAAKRVKAGRKTAISPV